MLKSVIINFVNVVNNKRLHLCYGSLYQEQCQPSYIGVLCISYLDTEMLINLNHKDFEFAPTFQYFVASRKRI